MNARTTPLLPLAVALVLYAPAVPARAGNSTIKQAAKDATEAFSHTTFVAKLDLLRYAEHFVLPDGSPAPQKQKKQGRGPGATTIQLNNGIKVRAGQTGEGIFVWTGKRDTIRVAFNPKHKPLNAVVVNILFDRDVTVDDFDPYKLALAVSSVAEIRGFEPETAIAAAFDQVLEETPEVPTSSAPPPSTAPTVLSLRVWAEPAQVRPGETVELKLEYQVQAPGGAVAAVETRELSLDGTMMPTYPVSEEISRAAGSYTSNYRQPLPASARPGTYSFEGEVCVAGDCIRRAARFEVVP